MCFYMSCTPLSTRANELIYVTNGRPKQLGGVAGGMKYLWRGILFKLADGSQGPYGGSDEAAAKAAGHELRGAPIKIPKAACSNSHNIT